MRQSSSGGRMHRPLPSARAWASRRRRAMPRPLVKAARSGRDGRLSSGSRNFESHEINSYRNKDECRISGSAFAGSGADNIVLFQRHSWTGDLDE